MGDQDNLSAPAPGCTAWNRYDVPQLAGFLSDDTEPAWGHARAWQRTMELADGYGRSMQKVRDGFAAIWPPEHSQAAQMFLGRLDTMIAALTDVRESASSNYTALTGVLQLLDDAKANIDELNDRYRSASTDERSLLNQQAQQQMGTADDEVLTYYSKLTKPAPYDPPVQYREPGSLLPPDGSAGLGRASDADRHSAGRGVLPWVGQSSSPAEGPPFGSSSTRRLPSEPTVREPGPVLTGGGATINGHDTSGSRPMVALPNDPSSDPAGSASPWWMVDTPRGSAMRYGAVIGMPPPESVAGIPGGSDDSPERRSVPPDKAASGEAAEHTGGLVGGGGTGGRSGHQRRRRLEPYYQWEAPTGVPPVIEPGPEPKHDPGPGVIGIDR